jgi:hypothetical protein
MGDVALLSMDLRSSPSTLERGELGHRVEPVDCYEVANADLSRFRVVVVGSMIDQEHLARCRLLLRAYLDGGGVVVFGGQLHRDWLPGASRFVALDRPSLRAY